MIVQSWNILIMASVLFVMLGSGVTWFALRLIRSNRDQILATAALVAEQEVTIREPGEVVLIAEVPRFGSDFRNLEFEVIEQVTGHGTTMKYDYMRAQGAVYGLTTMRVPLGRMTALRAGRYLVRVTGLQVGKNYSASRILLSRPYLGRMVGQILGIVACAVGMLLSLLLALWQLFPLQGNESPASSIASPGPGVPGRTIDLETWKRQQQPQPSPK
jgi:hypothetical protein